MSGENKKWLVDHFALSGKIEMVLRSVNRIISMCDSLTTNELKMNSSSADANANADADAVAVAVDYGNVTGDHVKTPVGHFRAIHRFRTEFLPLGQEDTAMTPQYDSEWEAAAAINGFPSVYASASAAEVQQQQHKDDKDDDEAEYRYVDGGEGEDKNKNKNNEDKKDKKKEEEEEEEYDDDYDEDEDEDEDNGDAYVGADKLAEFVEVDYYMPQLVIVREPDETQQQSLYNLALNKVTAHVKRFQKYIPTDADADADDADASRLGNYQEVTVGKMKYHYLCPNPYNRGPHEMNLLHGTGLTLDNGRSYKHVLACEYVVVTDVRYGDTP